MQQRHDVLPVLPAALGDRHDMVERQIRRGKDPAAVLARVIVARVDVRPRERHVVDVALDLDVAQQPDDRGQLEAERDRPDLTVVDGDHLHLPLAPKRHRLLPVDDLERFVRRVEQKCLLHKPESFCPMRVSAVNTDDARKMIVYSGLDETHEAGCRPARRLADTSDAPDARRDSSDCCSSCSPAPSRPPAPRPAPCRGRSRCPDEPRPRGPPRLAAGRRDRCRGRRRGRDGARAARRAVPERRQRPGRLRLQRVRLVRLRAARHRGAADGRGAVPGRAGRCRPSDCGRATWCSSKPAARRRRTSGWSSSGDEFVHAPSSRGEVRVEHLARAATGPAASSGAPAGCAVDSVQGERRAGSRPRCDRRRSGRAVLALAGQAARAALGELADVRDRLRCRAPAASPA